MVQNIKNTDRIVVELEMLQIDYNEEKKNSLRKEISNKYGVPEKNVTIVFKPVTRNSDGQRVSIADDVVNSVQDPQHQKNMMRRYIELNEYEDVNWDEIDAIDNQVNAFIDFDQYSKYKNYKFKYVKWSNYLSYGPDNFFDFTKLHGLVLLNSDPANQSGKTTFAIDLLRFALFGKADKSPNLSSVFNSYLPEETTVMVEACIEIDGEDYVIRRTVTRPALKKRTAKSKCTQKLEYFRKHGDDLELIENCEGESVQQTNNIIKDAVGNVEDFNLVISATSYSLGELLRMGQTDKGKLFSRWLGLLSIEEKENVAKKLWKDNYQKNLLSNKYNRETLQSEKESAESSRKDYEVLISKAETELKDCKDRIDALNAEKTRLLESLRPVKDGLDKLDMQSVSSEKERVEANLAELRAEFKAQKDEYAPLKGLSYDEDGHRACLDKKDKLTSQKNDIDVKNGEIRASIGILRKNKEKIEALVAQGTCPTCGHKIEACEHDVEIKAIEEEEKRLIDEGKANKDEIDRLTAEIEAAADRIKAFEKSKDDVVRKSKLELKMTATHANIESSKLKIEQLAGTLADMKTNEENIRFNNEVRAKVAISEASINSETSVRDSKVKNIESWKTMISMLDTHISEVSEIIGKLSDEEKVVRNWNLYLELVGKNGIVKLVLREALPIINNEVARILDGLCDFEVTLDVDEKNNVVINLVKDGVSMDLGTAASGFEGTVSSLALRSALAGVSTISKPNALTLDEILQGVAVENYDNVRELYNRIIGNYDFILHITHNELLYDWHDQHILVTKKDNVSSISFNDRI